MNLPSWHKHVSERQPGAWIDCTWDSGVEFVRLTHDKAIPATHAEGDALRKASGDLTGGSNIGDLRKGIRARYGYWPSLPISGFASLWSALTPGRAAVVQGSMAAFGPTHRLSRFDPQFDGGHAVLVIRLDSTSRVWWCDPEGPATGYNGEWITKAELLSFVSKFAGQHIVADLLPEPPPPPKPEPDMPALTSYLTGSKATVKVTANIRSAPSVTATKYRTVSAVETWPLIGTCKGSVDPETGSDQWYVWWGNGRYEYTAKGNVTGVVPPLTQSDVSAAVTRATDPLKAEIVGLNAKITKAKAALA